MLPPCASIIFLVIYNPKPEAIDLLLFPLETNFSKISFGLSKSKEQPAFSIDKPTLSLTAPAFQAERTTKNWATPACCPVRNTASTGHWATFR